MFKIGSDRTVLAQDVKGLHSDMASQVQAAANQSKKWLLLDELKACGRSRNLQRGKQLHAAVVESGNESCIYLATALVTMYSRCRSMADAHQVFSSVKHPDVVSWTALILGYAENGEGTTALDLFARMRSQGCAANAVTFVAALKACCSAALEQDGSKRAEFLNRGRQIHSEIGCHLDVYVRSTLINMYAKCGSMIEARRVFEDIKHPDVVSWNALILGYADSGEGVTALHLFARMKTQGCAPDSFTFVAALKACTSSTDESECLKRGKEIHLQTGYCSSDLYVQNALINMYAKCGNMKEARQIFDGMKHRDVVSWNALISGYAENGEGVTALDLFAGMKFQGFAPNCLTFVAALKACGLLGALECGNKIHEEICTDARADAIIVTCLVDFYAKCGDLLTSRKVFDSHPRTRDITTWNALLAGFSRLGDHDAAFGVVKEMQDAGFRPNGVTSLCILICCSHAGLVAKGKVCLEEMSTKYGNPPHLEHYNCLIDLFGRSNKLEEAVTLLQTMPCVPNAVTWMTVLAACGKWKNVEIGRLAFRALTALDERNATAYVLMAHIYERRGMRKEQEMVLEMKKRLKALEQSSEKCCWTSADGRVHEFYAKHA